MKTITEYLSGNFNDELRVLVAEARGWKHVRLCHTAEGAENGYWGLRPGFIHKENEERLPPYPTSRDACEELLADLTAHEWPKFIDQLGICTIGHKPCWQTELCRALIRASARQICVAYLIVKGVIKQ